MKLLQNYNKSLWIVRILFVVLNTVATYQDSLMIAQLYAGISSPIFVILSTMLSSVIIVVVFPWLIGVVVNFLHIHYLPLAEYKLLALLAYSIAVGIKLLVGLLIYAMPYAGVWIGVLGNVISLSIAMLIFYFITSRLYTNHMTRLYYFKIIIIAYVILFVVGVVL